MYSNSSRCSVFTQIIILGIPIGCNCRINLQLTRLYSNTIFTNIIIYKYYWLEPKLLSIFCLTISYYYLYAIIIISTSFFTSIRAVADRYKVNAKYILRNSGESTSQWIQKSTDNVIIKHELKIKTIFKNRPPDAIRFVCVVWRILYIIYVYLAGYDNVVSMGLSISLEFLKFSLSGIFVIIFSAVFLLYLHSNRPTDVPCLRSDRRFAVCF